MKQAFDRSQLPTVLTKPPAEKAEKSETRERPKPIKPFPREYAEEQEKFRAEEEEILHHVERIALPEDIARASQAEAHAYKNEIDRALSLIRRTSEEKEALSWERENDHAALEQTLSDLSRLLDRKIIGLGCLDADAGLEFKELLVDERRLEDIERVKAAEQRLKDPAHRGYVLELEANEVEDRLNASLAEERQWEEKVNRKDKTPNLEEIGGRMHSLLRLAIVREKLQEKLNDQNG